MTSLSYVHMAATHYDEFTIYPNNAATQIFRFNGVTVIFSNNSFQIKLVGTCVMSKKIAIKARENYSFMKPGIVYADPKPDGLAIEFGPLCQTMGLEIIETE